MLPLLLITTWFSYHTYSSTKPVYYSSAVIGLAPPSLRIDTASPDSGGVRRNGLLDVGGASLIANMTAVGLKESSVVSRVVAAGGLPDYKSEMFPTPAATPQLPLIMVEVMAPDPAAATKTLELVSSQADVTMRTLQQQARVPDDQMVAPFLVQPPTAPVAAMPSRTRSTIAIFAAGVGLSILFTVVLDIMLTRRKERTATNRQAGEAAGPSPDHPPSEPAGRGDGAPVTEGAMDTT
ncbi:hypothetical protein [Rhodococcus maanshanensis]|uniref:hypothetical protein n=1 Tax=Rhodococcus maanshanensis TaxID=183556 RepID=UPI0011602E7F|nr:hypothetical protein [Rhodococcus maanshanensis]